jgi:D-alanyl-D-alanine carboxypeptidase
MGYRGATVRRWLIAGLLGLTAAAPLPALGPAVDAAAAHGLEGVVLAGDADSAIFDRAVGMANRGTGRAHRMDDAWPIAPVTKKIVAVLVMQEVDAGRLQLDETLADALPTIHGQAAARITLRQLLQHTSRLPNPSATATATATAQDKDVVEEFYRMPEGPDAAIQFCTGTGAADPASAKFDYNNCDHLVLGAILERSSGLRVARLVTDRLHSAFTLPGGAQGFAAPQMGYVDGTKPEPLVRLATFGAAVAQIGKPLDLLALDRALLAGKLLSAQARATLWEGNPKLGYEALGQWVFPAKPAGCAAPMQLIECEGDIAGIQVRNYIAPATGRILIVFANRADVDFGQLWQGTGLGLNVASAESSA